LRTFENREGISVQHRSHPWSTSTGDLNYRYYDFRAKPEQISVVLEDLRPWDTYAAVQSIYGLLAWVNGPGSPFESNDCAFDGPEDNVDHGFSKRLQCCGRLGVLFRDLGLNTDERAMNRWVERIHTGLCALEPGFEWGAVGTTRLRVDYRDLPEGHAEGEQLLLSFWAWGDDEPEVFENLARVIAALCDALESSAG
jgi:hypothetical protein